MVLTLALGAAEALARALPARAAYALADLGGGLWHRSSPARRAVVEENLRRVCAATRRPTHGRAFDRLVRRAFVEHARYYLELLRAPHYPLERVGRHVEAERWEYWRDVLARGAVLATPHLGNFEPCGILLASAGITGVAPVEEIRPRELFEFMRRRRGAGRSVEVIPLARSRRRLAETLRRGQIVALVADRDLSGDGVPVQLFGHPATLPTGPAFLALATGAPLVAVSCLRVGRDRFHARGWAIDVERTGNRRADIEALTRALARRFEEAIGEAPEQWWAAFQPFWPDLRADAARRRTPPRRTAPRSSRRSSPSDHVAAADVSAEPR